MRRRIDGAAAEDALRDAQMYDLPLVHGKAEPDEGAQLLLGGPKL